MGAPLRRTRRSRPYHRVGTTLLHVLFGGGLISLASAQGDCSSISSSTVFRVEDATEPSALRAAVNYTNGGTVEAEWAGRVPVGAPIAVSSGTFLFVTGEDTLAEAYASTTTRLFEVGAGGGLTLTQLKLSGGTSADGGGAIYSRTANLTLDTCVLEDNVATDGNGGAVWAQGGTVTIVGGEFSNNTASRYGGAVHANTTTLVVEGGATFENNEAVVGSALFCEGSESADINSDVLCSLSDAFFTSNTAVEDTATGNADFKDLGGGGAAAFLLANVTVTDSVFSGNYARIEGGALYGGEGTFIAVDGSIFENNKSPWYGGAIAASSMTLGGGTRLINNAVNTSGGAGYVYTREFSGIEKHRGSSDDVYFKRCFRFDNLSVNRPVVQVFGWDVSGTITFNDVTCSGNTAKSDGGCYFGSGLSFINDGTVMHDNQAMDGGCLFASYGGYVMVDGGEFMCFASQRGGFLYAEEDLEVTITGGLIANNEAGRRGGAIYCSGQDGGGGSLMTIEGGQFINNTALVEGGTIFASGDNTVVNITGGVVRNSAAKFYGGFAYVEFGASLICEGTTITDNYPGDQGGGIYAREATWVNTTCNLIANESPDGAAIYLTNVKSATFENHKVVHNLASGGSVVYVAASSVVARGVTFESGVDLQEDSSNRAIQLDSDTTLKAEQCMFNGWLGDTVIYHANSAIGSLVLDSCDFSGSAAIMAVIWPDSDAEIRNAIVSSFTFENAVAGTVNNSLTLVDRALDCDDANACGKGNCVESTLGVLCECLESGTCLNDGGELTLRIKEAPADVAYSPDPVSYELLVSSAASGTTYAIWKLNSAADDLDLDVVPFSGVLAPGGNAIVTVTSTAYKTTVRGDRTSSFDLTSADGASLDSTPAGAKLEVGSTFYHCHGYEYAKPRDGDDGSISCGKCITIAGEEGVDCESPGATSASLPIREGYWRSDSESMVVRKCLNSRACKGGSEISSSDDYCRDGYKGPYCAVCTKGYGRSINTCHSCHGTKARLLITLGTLFSFVVLLLLLLAGVFLVGGMEAVGIVGQSTIRKLSRFYNACWRAILRARLRKEIIYDESPIIDGSDGIIAHGVDIASHVDGGGGERGPGLDGGSNSQGWEKDEPVIGCARPLGACAVVGIDVRVASVKDGHAPGNEETAAGRNIQRRTLACIGVPGPAMDSRSGTASISGVKSVCSMLGRKIHRWAHILPWKKIKTLIVIWQILAVFSGITRVEFPASYALFLSWINVWNFDIGYIISASCVLPSVNFYQRLIFTTLAPLVTIAGLVLTYRIANRRAGIGSAGVIARGAIWSRHVSAGLFITFLVFTSASCVVFSTFPFDENAVDGESYLTADYSISCQTRVHSFFKTHAAVMILVYPVGIPVLYSVVLWKHRELLNPRIHAVAKPLTCHTNENASIAHSVGRDGALSATRHTTSKGQPENQWSRQQLQDLDERVKARAEHPELVPFMSLLSDFGPNVYYYEVIECCRRIFLMDVLILIEPRTVTQATVGCIFALVNLLVFQLIRPHVDQADGWLYRLGCVLIFLSGFLAMMIKMDVADEANRSVFGVFLVALNVALIVAVSWFVMRHIKDASDEEETTDA